MLTLAEQILILLFDEERREFLSIGKYTLVRAMVAAVLMDLAFANRIDTDTERLLVLDREPTGNPLMDSVLERIAHSQGTKSASRWIEILAEEEVNTIRQRALDGLVERGFLKVQKEMRLLVFPSRRYAIVDISTARDAKLRIMNVLFSDVIPEPQDVSLVCLADACGILRTVFDVREIERIMPRIELMHKMDLIGREMIAQLSVWKLGYRRRPQA